jgi:hypothetical protein
MTRSHTVDRLRGAWRHGGREWFHVCLESPAGSLIVNLLVDGHRGRPEGVLTVLCVGEVASAVQQRSAVLVAEPAGSVLRLVGATLRFGGGSASLDVAHADFALSAALTTNACATAPSSTHFTEGTLHWSVVPDVRVRGTVRIGGRTWELGSRGYLDHNWGDAQWGPELAWEWSFTHFEDCSAVWMRMLRRESRASMGEALLLWSDDRIRETWTGAQIVVEYGAALRGVPQVTTPALLRHLLPDRIRGVPQVVLVRTREPRARLELSARHVGRIVVPDDVDDGASVIYEATCAATLHREGEAPRAGSGVMEVVRGA